MQEKATDGKGDLKRKKAFVSKVFEKKYQALLSTDSPVVYHCDRCQSTLIHMSFL